jgi:selenocysteine lyase/cysteine desulfurase
VRAGYHGRPMAPSHESDAQRLSALREMLPATGAGIYLDTATRGPLPAEAAEAMREAFDWDVRVGRVMPGREDDVAQRASEARAVIAAVLGATDPDAIVLTHGREDGLQAGRQALGLDGAAADHVDPVSGALNDSHGVRLLDATLSAGAIRLNVEQLGVEAVAVAGDRWLLGPEGIGALWLRDGAMARALPERELSRQLLLGLARSVGWLAMFVGLEWAYERTAALAARLSQALDDGDGVELLTSSPGAAVVSFRLRSWPAEDAADELNHRVQALTRPLAEPNVVRASVGWFNTEAEIDRFAEAVLELGRHTPESLPRRPRLVVLRGG